MAAGAGLIAQPSRKGQRCRRIDRAHHFLQLEIRRLPCFYHALGDSRNTSIGSAVLPTLQFQQKGKTSVSGPASGHR